MRTWLGNVTTDFLRSNKHVTDTGAQYGQPANGKSQKQMRNKRRCHEEFIIWDKSIQFIDVLFEVFCTWGCVAVFMLWFSFV
jgi:hypothetical protein